MKNLTILLIGCSLALSGAALAQQPVEQQSPSKGKRAPEKTHATEAKPGANAAKPQERPAKQTGAIKERGATTERGTTNEPGAGKGRKARANEESATAPAADTAGGAPPVSAAGQQNVRAKGMGAVKKPDSQQVQQIKSQHANFRAQPKPQQVPAVTFNQNYRIQGSEQWQGPQYEVFRSYHPEWHDQGWYRSHYNRVELIGGGYYYWNNGYWYPAWGYDPAAAYYAYDAPIYVGHSAEPPDQVIADVQAELQQMGYYKGEVDGLLGPLTREALAAYQADQGLTTTAVIDEPTLDSLGLA
jgi:Putative peptidoglycan binding domain